MIRQGKCNVQKDVIMTPVSLPELAIQIKVVVLRLRPMDVNQITAEETRQHRHTCEWSEGRHTVAGDNVRQTKRTLRFALEKRLLGDREICHDLCEVSNRKLKPPAIYFMGSEGLHRLRQWPEASPCQCSRTDQYKKPSKTLFGALRVPSNLLVGA